MRDSKNKKNKILMLVALASIFVLLYCGLRLGYYTLSYYNAVSEADGLKKLVGDADGIELTEDEATGQKVTVVRNTVSESVILDKYKELYELNNDLVGWISIDDSSIDYPVMADRNGDEFYLSHDFYGEKDKHGLPFTDSRCDALQPSDNVIIYGHNMKDGTMFADLTKFSDKDYYENHRFIRFDTIYGEAFYEVIAAFSQKAEEAAADPLSFYNYTGADSSAGLEDFLESVRALSLYTAEPESEFEDSLISLSTCDSDDNSYRFVVIARKVKSEGS